MTNWDRKRESRERARVRVSLCVAHILVHTFETSTTHDVAHHQRGFEVAFNVPFLVVALVFGFVFDLLLEILKRGASINGSYGNSSWLRVLAPPLIYPLPVITGYYRLRLYNTFKMQVLRTYVCMYVWECALVWWPLELFLLFIYIYCWLWRQTLIYTWLYHI